MRPDQTLRCDHRHPDFDAIAHTPVNDNGAAQTAEIDVNHVRCDELLVSGGGGVIEQFGQALVVAGDLAQFDQFGLKLGQGFLQVGVALLQVL